MTDSTKRAADAERLAEIRADLHNIAFALMPEPRDAIQGIIRFLLHSIDDRDAIIARLEQDRDAYKGASRDCHDALGRCAVERDELRAEVGRLRAEFMTPPECDANCTIPDCPYIHQWTPKQAPDTKSLRHPLTGDTATHTATEAQREKNQQWAKGAVDLYEEITRTGRILETRPAASREVELAWEIMEDALLDDENPAWNERTVQVIAEALLGARLSSRADTLRLCEKVLIERLGGSAGYALAAIRTLSEETR